MEILNVGPFEIILIIVLAFVVLGPKEGARAVRQVGVFLNRLFSSKFWSSLVTTTNEISELPQKLARESGMDETIGEISGEMKDIALELDPTRRIINRNSASLPTEDEASDKP